MYYIIVRDCCTTATCLCSMLKQCCYDKNLLKQLVGLYEKLAGLYERYREL